MTHSENTNLSGDVAEVLRVAIATERKVFLHRLHIYLAGAGALVGLARLANQFNVPAFGFLVGWPTTFIWVVGAGICLYSLYLLIHKRSKGFMARPISASTRKALLGNPAVATLGQTEQLKVADLCQLHAQQA